MDRYTARINLHGVTQRARNVDRLRDDILKNLPDNPSYKKVLLNGAETYISITKGTQPYYKEFASLPGQKILPGDYIEWLNKTWLVYDADCDEEIYVTGDLRQCQHKIYWQNSDGNIISRYVWTQNASAYNNGEKGNDTITLQSNQFMVYLPYDEDTSLLDNGVRMHMSRSNIKCKPYTLTRPDDITYGYGEKGVLNIIFTQTQYNEQADKLVTLDDGSQVWICDYHSPAPQPTPPEEITDSSVSISGGSSLRCGRAKSWMVVFRDKNGNEVMNQDFKWNVVSKFNVKQNIDGSKIQLRIDNEDLIGSSFLLQVIMTVNNEDTVVAENEITIAQGL